MVTWPGGHGLDVGAPVSFSAESGTLPTGVTADKIYYVISAGLTATTFQFAETPGGSAVEASAAGTATTITATAQPQGATDLLYGLALDGAKQGGEANTAIVRTWSIAVDSNILSI